MIYVDVGAGAEKSVREKWRLLKATMDERARRLWAGTEAGAIGYGGVAAVARATGLAISTVRKGRDEARARSDARRTSSRFGGAAGKRTVRERHIPRCGPRWRSSSIRSRAATPNRRCGGRVRARTCWPPSCSRRTAFGSATRRWPSCCATTGTAFRRRASPSRVPSIPIATRSSSTSTPRRRPASLAACR